MSTATSISTSDNAIDFADATMAEATAHIASALCSIQSLSTALSPYETTSLGVAAELVCAALLALDNCSAAAWQSPHP
jgi:hypothetical protein